MSGIRELHTTWLGVAGAPYYTTLRQTTVGVLTAQDFADSWIAFLNNLKPNYVNELTARVEPELTVIESTTGQLIGTEVVTGASVVGTNNSFMVPRASQGLLKWSTDLVIAGRRLRGRTFLPGLSTGLDTEGGGVSAGIAATIGSQAQGFLDTMGGEMVIYSRTHKSGSAVTGVSMWTEWASLRSRRD